MTKIKLAYRLSLGLDAVTQTFGFLGIRGAGKTYAATKLAEGMLDAGAQVVALDPVGKWWGLRLAADGKSPGIDVPVLGGLNGDLPLDPKSGKLVAQTIVKTDSSAILDVSLMRKNGRKQFVTEFCEELFHLRARDPQAMHVFLEEAHKFAPQMSSGQEQMLGAVEDIVRLGRNHGIGSTLIDQRPQSVNKNVLNQVECLCVLRLNGAHERKAIMEWIRAKGVDLKEMADQLPELKTGEAMLWSPSWLRKFVKIKILEKRTFDSSATPKVGKRKNKARKLKTLDVDELRVAMASFVEQVEANDPKVLKRRIAKLEKELATTGNKHVAVRMATEDQVEKRIRMQLAGYERQIAKVQDDFVNIATLVATHEHAVRRSLELLRSSFESLCESATRLEVVDIKPPAPVLTLHKTAPAPPRTSNGAGAIQQKVLDAVAWWETVGIEHPTRRQVGFVAGYTMNGYFNRSIGAMRSEGLIVYPSSGAIGLTDRGRADATRPAASPTTPELQKMVLAQLNKTQRKILDACLAEWPEDFTRAELADATGYTQNGYFNRTVGNMRTLKLIEYPEKGRVRASDLLFLETR